MTRTDGPVMESAEPQEGGRVMSAAPPAVVAEGLVFGWGRKPVLHGVDLEVRRGEVLALVGANGAGKSTFLQLVCAAEPYRRRFSRATKGRLEVLGLDPQTKGQRVRSQVGFVADHTELPEWMRVRDHLALVRAVHPRYDDAEAHRWLDAFGLDADAKHATLSKGQRMLESLAVALALRPPLLLLDEPFAGLDPVARRLVADGIIEHMCEEGRSVLLVSHSTADVERCADRVAVMAAGRVTAVETVEALRERAGGGDLEDALVAAAAEGRAA